jgi:hypothetical protein
MICTVDKSDKRDNTRRHMQILSPRMIRSCEWLKCLMKHRKWLKRITRSILNIRASNGVGGEKFLIDAISVGKQKKKAILVSRPPLWSSGQSSWLRSRAPGSIPGATTFTEKLCVWNGVHSASLSTIEELLEIKSNGSGLENREYGRRDPSR